MPIRPSVCSCKPITKENKMNEDVKAMLQTYAGAEQELMAELLDMEEEDEVVRDSTEPSDEQTHS